MGLFTFMKMETELKVVLVRKVDVVTDNSINKFIKPYILNEIQPIYSEK